MSLKSLVLAVWVMVRQESEESSAANTTMLIEFLTGGYPLNLIPCEKSSTRKDVYC